MTRSSLPQLLLTCVAVLSLAPRGSAQGSLADSTFTLEQAVEAAKNENAQLRSLASMREALVQRSGQESALPNPMFTFRGMNEVESYQFPGEETRFELEQSFPWFGKRGLRGRVAEKEADAMGMEVKTMQREIIFMVKEAYFELYAVQKSVSITQAEENLLKQMEAIALAKYGVGEVSQQDVLKAQAEISMLKARWIDLEQQAVALKAKLNQLLNRPADSSLGRAVSAPPLKYEVHAEQLATWAQTNRPEIALAQAQIERDLARRDLMNKEFWPDYRLGLEYRSFRSGPDMLMFTVGFDIPIWRSRYRSGAREAESMVESGQAALEAAQRQTSYDVRRSIAMFSASQQTVNLYQTALIPQAEARFTASEAGYRSGQIGFLELLESERFLLDARLMTAMAEGQMGMSFAQLERAVGTELTVGVTPPDMPEPGNDE